MLMMAEKYKKTRDVLHEIKITDRNNRTDRWLGVQHGELADMIVTSAIDHHGLDLVSEQWGTNPDGGDMFGCLDFRTPREQGIHLPKGVKLSLGVRHSNRGRFAVSFAVGARVTVCANGMFVGEFNLKHRHTTGIDLEGLINGAFDRFLKDSQQTSAFISDMQQHRLTDQEASHLIMQAAHQKAMAWKYVEEVFNLYTEPPHAEFEQRTAWSLYNAFTETAKTMSPVNQFRLLEVLGTLVAN